MRKRKKQEEASLFNESLREDKEFWRNRDSLEMN
jgi:hypothetical protein